MLSFGEKIKQIRQAKGLSIRSFARIVNLSYGYISKLEKIESGNPNPVSPSVDVIKQICDRSHYDFATFLIETGYLSPNVIGLGNRVPESVLEVVELINDDDVKFIKKLVKLSGHEKLILINMLKGLVPD